MTPKTVLVDHADSPGPQKVTLKAFKAIYEVKGYYVVEPEATSARPATFVADSTVEQVLAWVDGIPQRAREALEAELAKLKPRRSLVERLEVIADEPEDEPEDGPAAA